MEKKPNVGGQAVIEGVMMRGKDKIAVAVRRRMGKLLLMLGRLTVLQTSILF